MDVKRTERGWAGHFICAHQCRFRRNTLLECGNVKIVVSTVGLLDFDKSVKKIIGQEENEFKQIGYKRYYETMAFHSDPKDTRYHDADVSREVSFGSEWTIDKIDADDAANDMHEAVVAELTQKLLAGERFERKE